MRRLLLLKKPPVVGKVYAVPCLILRGLPPLPILGVEHNDKDLGVISNHLHADQRFISDLSLHNDFGHPLKQLMKAGECPGGAFATNMDAIRLYNIPFTFKEKPLRCLRQFPQKECFKASGPMLAWEREKIVARGFTHLSKDCRVCPHKGTPLDNVRPVNGKILCPAHGMEFDARTGAILKW